MRNFKMTLEYVGTEFCGWQTQAKGFRTVQSHIEEKLEKIFKKKIHCHASGRTDSGVHAIGQVAHFKVDTAMEPVLIHRALNAFLDKDVSVVGVEEVPLDFHAQRSVKSKTYRYTILNRLHPSALWRTRAYYYPHKLNISNMRKAAHKLKGKHDFKSFQHGSERLNTVRTIKDLTIVKEGDMVHISIASDGFLYHMVRNIVGFLIEAGRGGVAVPKTAPSHGLCLMSVSY